MHVCPWRAILLVQVERQQGEKFEQIWADMHVTPVCVICEHEVQLECLKLLVLVWQTLYLTVVQGETREASKNEREKTRDTRMMYQSKKIIQSSKF